MATANGTNTAADLDTAGRLAAAAAVATQAPSIHNTQPWRWHIQGGVADLHADTRRQLNVTDPERRLLTISCGAALHHARVALAAAGQGFEVQLMPTPGDPLHLARIMATGSMTVTDQARRLRRAIDVRHSDRRPLKDEPVPSSVIAALQDIARGFASGLQPLDRADVLTLAAATSRAQQDEIDDVASRHELDAWAGTRRSDEVGVPDANIPFRPTETTVPSRDFGHVGTLPVNDRHDHAATYAILYGFDDDARAWLHAGEALSAIWLHAADRGIAVLPLSAAVEEPSTRQLLNRLLDGIGYAQLAVRLGISDPSQGEAPRTPRLPTSEVIKIDT